MVHLHPSSCILSYLSFVFQSLSSCLSSLFLSTEPTPIHFSMMQIWSDLILSLGRIPPPHSNYDTATHAAAAALYNIHDALHHMERLHCSISAISSGVVVFYYHSSLPFVALYCCCLHVHSTSTDVVLASAAWPSELIKQEEVAVWQVLELML